ncbi:TetR family transcriptional regulator [Wukongibacter sp. M2B1]|uniref:TetR/AcrR family transcriptional regulator n=1 Tax=Wukongibacter sp. M2B1 TaxID=3088895 RepID=UPI003D7A07DD
MNKKEIQKKRMMGYFIEATSKIIEEEGVEAVTIRKVADLAGYNSATLYNYFDNLNHLIFFSSMKFLKDYVIELSNYIKNSTNSIERYLSVWKCFCYHSFNNPKIYYIIFFDKYSDSINDAIKSYYSIFPEELEILPQEILPMLLERNLSTRNMTLLEYCAQEGILDRKNLNEINEIVLLLYQGMLLRVLNNNINYDITQAIERTMKYINQIIYSFQKNH